MKMRSKMIITVPKSYLATEEVDSVVVMDVPPRPSRKRRLDHLTREQKRLRKKFMNRVAAHTSRERKQARMDEMEHKLNQLIAENEKLTNEFASQKALNERLLSENTSLRSAAAARDVSNGQPEECSQGPEVVRSAAKHVESGEGVVSDRRHDVHRILPQHSYAHPYTPDIVITQPKEQNNDKGDMFFANCDDENDCETVEVPCEDQVEDTSDSSQMTDLSSFDDLTLECDLELLSPMSLSLEDLSSFDDLTFEYDMELLSPMSLSPVPMDKPLFGLSPAHTSLSSDPGYESLASPLSDSDSFDLPDFWSESLAELFPGLARL